jgi:hypothetical protein
MATASVDPEDKTRRTVFLKVERGENCYIETDLRGQQTRYYRHPGTEAIGLEDLKVSRSISPTSGAAKYYLTAVTEAKFRAIGAERAYQIFHVSLSAEFPQGKAVLKERFAPDGHALHATLQIGLSETALEEIVKETRAAPSPRKLDVHLKGNSFFSTHPEWGSAGSGMLEKTYLLSYWADEPQSKSGVGHNEHIEVTWIFDTTSVTVRPELDERVPYTEAMVTARIDRPVGVYYQPPREGDALNPLNEPFVKIIKAIEALRTALYIIGAAVALVAWKLLFGRG